jgi:hypothetical protein
MVAKMFFFVIGSSAPLLVHWFQKFKRQKRGWRIVHAYPKIVHWTFAGTYGSHTSQQSSIHFDAQRRAKIIHGWSTD